MVPEIHRPILCRTSPWISKRLITIYQTFETFVTRIDKVKPYLGESPKGWVDTVVETEVAEMVENVAE